MKKISLGFIALLLLSISLVACSSKDNNGGGSNKDYETILRAARSEEENQSSLFEPITNTKTELYQHPTEELINTLIENEKQYAADMGEDISDADAEMFANSTIQRYLDNVDFMMSTTFAEGGFSEYAISSPGIITLAYGVFIIMPDEGKSDVVMQQVEDFVEYQKKACENYLLNQYEIAKSAIIKTAPSGEILLAMCEDAPTVMQNMLDGLAQ